MAIDAIWTIVKETTKLCDSVMAVVKTISPGTSFTLQDTPLCRCVLS